MKTTLKRFIQLLKHFLCRSMLHNWKYSHGTGINEYHECLWCKKREVRYSMLDGYQPIDKDWINKQPDSFNHTPPNFK